MIAVAALLLALVSCLLVCLRRQRNMVKELEEVFEHELEAERHSTRTRIREYTESRRSSGRFSEPGSRDSHFATPPLAPPCPPPDTRSSARSSTASEPGTPAPAEQSRRGKALGGTMRRIAKLMTPGAKDATSPKKRLSAARHSNARELEEAQHMDWSQWDTPAPAPSDGDENPLQKIMEWFQNLTPPEQTQKNWKRAVGALGLAPANAEAPGPAWAAAAARISDPDNARASNFGGSFRQMTRDRSKRSVIEDAAKGRRPSKISFGSPKSGGTPKGSPALAKV